MIRQLLGVALIVGPVAAWAQNQPAAPPRSQSSRPYQPAVPSPSVNIGGGYGGGYGGGGTAAGNAMQGMASVISAQGNYNLSTSAAAINMTEAQRNYIENRQQATDAYFDMRAANRQYTAAERGPRLTAEQLARISQEYAPRPLNSMQVDPVTGKVNWPALLQDPRYSAQREEVEQIVAKQVSYGGLGLDDQNRARGAIDTMFETMKANIKSVPGQQYTSSRTFLRSLNYSLSQTELN